MTTDRVEDLLRRLAPQVLGAVVRRYGHCDTAEDAVQEALLAAALRWPTDGVPHSPKGWLITVAARPLTDLPLRVLYLVFNEGYVSTAGPHLQRAELSAEAIRLARLVHRLLPDDAEVTGLLALMLLTDARRAARTGPDGALIPMAEQDRRRWDRGRIAEGVALISEALPRGPTGTYQLQAAIAAVHDEASSAAVTDWPQIMALYEVLLRLSDNPVVALNHAVAVAMVRGAPAGLALLDALGADGRIAGDHRLYAVRGHLLELAGEHAAARESYEAAARRAPPVCRSSVTCAPGPPA